MNAWTLLMGGLAAVLFVAGTRAAAPNAGAEAEFDRRFAAVQAAVLDAHGAFRYSQVYPELEALESLAQRTGTDSPQRARVLDLMSLVRFKRGDFDEVVRLGEACLALKSADMLVPADRILLIHRVARAADNLHRYALAVQRYRAALDLDTAAGGTLLEPMQRLGIAQSIGYVLHEDGRYAEALAQNTATLRGAERVLGTDDASLTGILRNIAQNQYKLGLLDEAAAMLRRCLALAQRVHKDEVADDCLFQLGVLAFERGDVTEARRWMKQRISLAEQAQDEQRKTQALQAADELEQRIGKH